MAGRVWQWQWTPLPTAANALALGQRYPESLKPTRSIASQVKAHAILRVALLLFYEAVHHVAHLRFEAEFFVSIGVVQGPAQGPAQGSLICPAHAMLDKCARPSPKALQ
jgi:hypothetical protein